MRPWSGETGRESGVSTVGELVSSKSRNSGNLKNQRQVFEPQELSTWFQQRNMDQRTFLTYHKNSDCFPAPQMPCSDQCSIHNAFPAILKYVAAQQPTHRQFRYSNRPVRCSTQLSRYYGRYHEHCHLQSQRNQRKITRITYQRCTVRSR